MNKRLLTYLLTYMDCRVGDHQAADQGCVWLFGCRSKYVGPGFDCGL